MKILLVNKFHYLKGGSEKYYFELAKLLKKNGHEVAFFSMKDEKNIKTDCKEYFVESVDLNSGNKLKALDIIYSKANYNKMKEALEDFKPDIVHLNNFQRQLSASIIKAIKEKNIPMVYTAHDMNAICPSSVMLCNGKICEDCIKKGYYACVKKKCIKNSKLKSILGVIEKKYYDTNKIFQKIDCIISPSNYNKNKLISGNIKYNKIEVMPNFILTNDKLDENYHLNISENYAFFFGRLSIEKGIMNLIQAFKNIDCGKLYIAGDGPEKENIEKYIKKEKIENKIKLLGYLEPQEIQEYIKKSAFIVVPSICNENCPYSILETMKLGKAVIGSSMGGIPELIRENENGLLYQYNDTNELYEKIKLLFEKEEIRSKMEEKTVEIFKNNYTDKIYYDKLINLYNVLIKEKINV